jgi:hypothetical protein
MADEDHGGAHDFDRTRIGARELQIQARRTQLIIKPLAQVFRQLSDERAPDFAVRRMHNREQEILFEMGVNGQVAPADAVDDSRLVCRSACDHARTHRARELLAEGRPVEVRRRAALSTCSMNTAWAGGPRFTAGTQDEQALESKDSVVADPLKVQQLALDVFAPVVVSAHFPLVGVSGKEELGILDHRQPSGQAISVAAAHP